MMQRPQSNGISVQLSMIVCMGERLGFDVLYELKACFAVAIRSNHAVGCRANKRLQAKRKFDASSVMVRQNFATSVFW